MATSDWGVNDAEAVKLWQRKTMREALKHAYAGRFMGDDSNSLLQVKDDTAKSAGDRITTILRMQLTGAGIQGDNTLEGNEEALITYTENIFIDQLRHAVRSGGKMSEQRVPFSVREEARLGLQDWWSDRFDTWFFNQISGFAAQTNTKYTGNQAATSPDSGHIVYAGVATKESNLSQNATQTFTLEVIDKAVLAARTLTPVIRPINNDQEPGMHKFVAFITPEQHYDLRRSTNTQEWMDYNKAALTASERTKNPIFTGALGMYNGTVIHESSRLPRTTTGSGALTGGRAVFCGAQAAAIAFGRGYQSNRLEWNEELFDYGNQLGVSTGIIGGLKKCVFNSKDFATIVMATAHSANAVAAAQRS